MAVTFRELESHFLFYAHTQYGFYYRTRVPKFGRDLAYHFPSCDLYVAAARYVNLSHVCSVTEDKGRGEWVPTLCAKLLLLLCSVQRYTD